jgi:hypothetical protein
MPRTVHELDTRRGRSAVYTQHAHLVLISKYRSPCVPTRCEHLMR